MSRFLQFGTSRLLQAHADLFIGVAGSGRITVVQSSGDADRARRLAALADPAGFPVKVRGLQDGVIIDRTDRVRSVERTLSTATDWPAIVDLACGPVEIILSNTADAGYDPRPADGGAVFDQAMSFPAKLYHLLLARHAAGARPVQVMPTELITSNGDVLRDRVLDLAQGQPAAVRDWLRDGVVWVNSLVDRIVSEPIEPAGAVAEPYALWAIAAAPRVVCPAEHPAVIMAADLAPYAQLKLWILNLGHTLLAQAWKDRGGADPQFVRQVMDDAGHRARLEDVMTSEVLPGFAAAGMGKDAARYLSVTLERFANPFLDHRLSEIAGNHAQKIQRRAVAFRDWARANGDSGAKPVLDRLIAAA